MSLADGDGNPVVPVDPSGAAMAGAVTVTRAGAPAGGATVTWYLGAYPAGENAGYRVVCLPPGARGSFQVYVRVNDDVADGASVLNSAQVIVDRVFNADPAEQFLGNNQDQSQVTVYRADLAVAKRVVDVATGDENFTDAGSELEYTIEYDNLGNIASPNVVIEEIVPKGTSLGSINNPRGSQVEIFDDDGDGRDDRFIVTFSSLPAPASFVADTYTSIDGNNVNDGRLRYYEPGTKHTTINDATLGGSPLSTGDGFGSPVVPIGDLDGNGVIDLVVGSPGDGTGGIWAGTVYVVFLNQDGTVNRWTTIDDTTLLGGPLHESDLFGSSIAVLGDVDGNGVPDLAVGAYGDSSPISYGGAVYVVRLNADGTVTGWSVIDDGTLTGSPLTAQDRFGSSVAALGDVDGDGVPDLIAGAPYDPTGGYWAGAAYVVRLNSNGTVKGWNVLDAGTLPGNKISAVDQFGASMAGLGDLDGDNVPDVAISAPRDGSALYEAGSVYIVRLNSNGTAKGLSILDDSTLPGSPLEQNDHFGSSVALLGDMDGDGVPDLAVGAPSDSTGGTEAGAAYVVRLNADGTAKGVTVIDDTTVWPITSQSHFGAAVAALGDVDGNGVPDLVVGAPSWAWDEGKAFAVLIDVDQTVKSYIQIALGIQSGNYFGSSLAGIGDFDADGVPDLVVGTPRDSQTGGEYSGAAYLVMLGGGYETSGTYETTIESGGALLAWRQLQVNQDVPDGTSLSYTVGRYSDGSCIYDLGAVFTNQSLPSGVLDLSAISTSNTTLCLKADFVTTDRTKTPFFEAWRVTYLTAARPSFTFSVYVDDQIEGLNPANPAIPNAVSILGDTAETNLTNNTATDSILVRTVDLAMSKRVDYEARLEGGSLLYTLAIRNNGPHPARYPVVQDTLPVGVSYVPGSANPPETYYYGSGTNGDPYVLVWETDTSDTGWEPADELSIEIPVTIDAGTAGLALLNKWRC